MEGKVEGGGMKAGAGGKCYHAPTLLGAEEVKQIFILILEIERKG
jgi:hypothetical protein